MILDSREVLKIIRIKKNMSQKKICSSITDQGHYSRIENELSYLSTEHFVQFQKKLNAVHADFDEIALMHSDYYEKILNLQKRHLNLPTTQPIPEVYRYLDSHKNDHAYVYKAYISCKKLFHQEFPNEIPELSKEELDSIIKNITEHTYHTYYDLSIFFECIRYYNVEELLQSTCNLVPFSFNMLHTPNELKNRIYPKIIQNIADFIIDYYEFEKASELLRNNEMYLNYYTDYKMQVLKSYTDLKIKLFKATGNHASICSDIEELAYFTKKHLKDDDLSFAITHELKSIRKNNFKPQQQIYTITD